MHSRFSRHIEMNEWIKDTPLWWNNTDRNKEKAWIYWVLASTHKCHVKTTNSFNLFFLNKDIFFQREDFWVLKGKPKLEKSNVRYNLFSLPAMNSHTCVTISSNQVYSSTPGFNSYVYSYRGEQNMSCKMCPFGVRVVLSWKQFQPQQTQSQSPLTTQKNLDRGPVPGRELLLEITFYIRETPLHGMENTCSPNICSSCLLVYCLSPFWSPRCLSPSPYQTVKGSLIFVCHSPKHKICFSSVNLSSVSLIIRPDKELRREEGERFLPLQSFLLK